MRHAENISNKYLQYIYFFLQFDCNASAIEVCRKAKMHKTHKIADKEGHQLDIAMVETEKNPTGLGPISQVTYLPLVQVKDRLTRIKSKHLLI